MHRDRFAPRAGAPHPPGFQYHAALDRPDAFRDDVPRQVAGAMHAGTPPYGNARASLAAIRRRVRSSTIRRTNANFFRSGASGPASCAVMIATRMRDLLMLSVNGA
jgi:hypothetical protein